ncbi:OmpP1/FadL family transporter [Hydrocarboniphaga sp.]|uniref:OmpP1/FadL family transporter n=1 Tax=Hydrocarboniphaga sp. TaxID=2033016 RepID=UPI003D0F6F8A
MFKISPCTSAGAGAGRLLVVMAAVAMANPAQAGLGVFEHGAGIKAMGFGGVSYAVGDESTSLPINPAVAVALGNRFDVGVDIFAPRAVAAYRGNMAPGPADARYLTESDRYYPVPQGGAAIVLDDRTSLGFTLYSAGLGPHYRYSPYQRFGGAPRASLDLASTSLTTALAYRLTPSQAVGVGLSLGYQTLNVQGLQFLGATEPASQLSDKPGRTTNMGNDGALTAGFSLGWQGQLTPSLAAGAGYRSRSWAQQHKEYAGLLPGGGSLQLPAVYGAGFTYRFGPAWTAGFDWQRIANESEKMFGNRLSALSQGQRFGAEDGPGFGFRDQSAYKFGLAWQVDPALLLRAGYIHANEPVRESDTLLAFLGCVTSSTHYTLGMTYVKSAWEYSGFFAYEPSKRVEGHNSIPASFGGGEADVAFEVYSIGVSLGRHF